MIINAKDYAVEPRHVMIINPDSIVELKADNRWFTRQSGTCFCLFCKDGWESQDAGSYLCCVNAKDILQECNFFSDGLVHLSFLLYVYFLVSSAHFISINM